MNKYISRSMVKYFFKVRTDEGKEYDYESFDDSPAHARAEAESQGVKVREVVYVNAQEGTVRMSIDKFVENCDEFVPKKED